jgi:predicted nuclease of predicted toxin-antitoxin system
VKFKIDENLPLEVSLVLRGAGFDVHTIRDEQLTGADDGTVARHTAAESRVLITLDLDFADLRKPPGPEPLAAIVLRPRRQDKNSVVALVRRLAMVLSQRLQNNELWILQDERNRIRSLDGWSSQK